jgi:cyclopropane fatty-acyl-phospholipid synthase-like methyltransferase
MKYRDDYVKLHEGGMFPGMTLAHFADPVIKLLRRHEAKTVLDYGAGKGLAWEQIEALKRFRAESAAVTLYDPGLPEFEKRPEGAFDGVLCIDVAEHVPEEEVADFLGLVFGYAERVVIASFCARGSKKKLPSTGGDVHVTQKPRLWWEERMHLANSMRTRPIPWYLFENP